ncbi:MAG TPA: prepilin-type N-terminal cleavage/methylation domain-containing protein [Candidatus Saccharimonadales bacterium]|nr:prepilin-type N-terminal cleavage/methylation domain-containing protein [Candidatus Saccharimonadales bacterium]
MNPSDSGFYQKALRLKSNGVTIVEIMFVMAIAGVFLMVVFLAIPTLARNSRNNQRKQDVQVILAAVSLWELEKSANFPAPCGDLITRLCSKPPGLGVIDPLYYSQSKLTFYKGDKDVVIVCNDPICAATPFSAGHNPNTDTATVYVYNQALCDTDNKTADRTYASYTDDVALYALEGAHGNQTSICQQL